MVNLDFILANFRLCGTIQPMNEEELYAEMEKRLRRGLSEEDVPEEYRCSVIVRKQKKNKSNGRTEIIAPRVCAGCYEMEYFFASQLYKEFHDKTFSRVCFHCKSGRNREKSQEEMAFTLSCMFCGDDRNLDFKPPAGKGRSLKDATRYINDFGYVMVERDGWKRGSGVKRFMMEHRKVFEQHLGRKLFAFESVHHVDGNQENNHIDNLELWHGKHGPGKRDADMTNEEIDNYIAYLLRLKDDRSIASPHGDKRHPNLIVKGKDLLKSPLFSGSQK